jgi:hypothetical protein
VDANTYLVDQTKNLVDLLVGLGWPAVALIILVTFRRQIGALIGRIREGEAFGTKWKFDPAEAEPAVEAASETTTGQSRAPSYFAQDTQWLRELARERPELAVVGAYAEVEKALKQRMEQQGVEPGRLAGMQLIQEALKGNVIADPVAEAVQSLRRLRNAAAHGGAVDIAKALDYIDLCDQVLFILTWDQGS